MNLEKQLAVLLDELDEARDHVWWGREEHARLRLDDAVTRVHLVLNEIKEQKDESKAD